MDNWRYPLRLGRNIFVTAVIDPQTFQYQQPGPDTTTTNVGTVTPFGQAAPGQHQLQVLFLTRQGAITAPSPPTKFIANGGQYLSVTNIAIGPPNVVARILAFTGAQGAYFFYIPVPAQVNGLVVSTATQINDNTTTSAILDFSDNTLFAAIGISVPGNDTANQIVLDSALGFGYYGSRLLAYGQRNTIQNLLNMGFDGGYLPSAVNLPSGWTTYGSGTLAPGHFGYGWQIDVAPSAILGKITQGGYEDAYGAPILTGDTPYSVRLWASLTVPAADVRLTVSLTSASTGFSVTAVFFGNQMSATGGWLQLPFSGDTPSTIPTDMLLSIYAQSSVTTAIVLVDEVSLAYAQNPYLDSILYGSYVNNPEAFDGVSGKFGPSQDTRKVMDFGVVRGGLYLLTQDPSGRLHETVSSDTSEPAGWIVNEVGANCGALSAFSLTKSQADDATGSGGEEWFAWASSSGARIFGGSEPWKISQEIQPNWTGDVGRGFKGLNFAAATAIWAVNDPVARVIYFGVPSLDKGDGTACNLILPVNYRELDTPGEVYAGKPVRTSYTGRLIATDQTRKWTRWNLACPGGALMYRQPGQLSMVFFGNAGNVYTFGNGLTDDDYGIVVPYYITAFVPGHDEEVALQLGNRKMLAYLISLMSGTGNMVITPLRDSLTGVWPLTGIRALTAVTRDAEWAGGQATGYRMAFKLGSVPVAGTDNGFVLQKVTVWLRQVARLRVRGTA